ncbi:hypothetical protein [Plantactinospora mayteni]|nr:hypothetical protein [Plantactinospora mayteni]
MAWVGPLIDDHVWYQAWQTFDRTTPTGARMHATSQFFQHLGQDMAHAAEHWRHMIEFPPL